MPQPCRQCKHCNEEAEDTVVKSVDDDPPVRAVVRSIVADLMQRRPDLNASTTIQARGSLTCNVTDVVTDLAGESLAELQAKDPVIGEFVKMRLQCSEQPLIDTLQLSSETTKILWSQWFRFVVKDGIVYRLWFGKNG